MPEPKTIAFHNKISPAFQQVHVDGAIGGVTPRGKININFFAERFPIPKSAVFEVEANTLGKKIADSEDSKVGIIREYHFGVYMDLDTAKSLSNWLVSKIGEFETRQGEKNGTRATE